MKIGKLTIKTGKEPFTLKNKALMETIKEEVKSFDLSENELMELEFI